MISATGVNTLGNDLHRDVEASFTSEKKSIEERKGINTINNN
jgi:hypothetical protein